MGKSLQSFLVYDLEIIKAIPSNREPVIDGIQYCGGWNDHAGMGISVIGAYDSVEDRYRVFCQDNFGAFFDLVEKRELLVGFNTIPFDNEVIFATTGVRIPEEKCYDLLREIWAASGLGRVFEYPSHAGYGLEAVCSANFGKSKSGNGALAPIQWQRGEIGAVIDYCLNDVYLELELYLLASSCHVKCPKTGNQLRLRSAFRESQIISASDFGELPAL